MPRTPDRTASLGFEDALWAAADLLRSTLDPAEYKHVVLGLLFLKATSDGAGGGALRVPEQASWASLVGRQDSPTLGAHVDAAMVALEVANPVLRGALPQVFSRQGLGTKRLRELIALVSDLGLHPGGQDTLGRVYEYFLSRFASAEGRGGGEFYTPTSVVQLLVAMIQPYAGTLYDPCCGSGGMFVQSLRLLAAQGDERRALRVYGQESNPGTWRMARMNMALRGVEAHLGAAPADTLLDDQHPGLKADHVLANPPFNISRWGGDQLADDPRWVHGTPPPGNANFAWLQHIVSHLAPGGTAGVVLANGSLSVATSGEGDIRRRLVEADLVDCIVALPERLFYATPIPACLWVLARDKAAPGQRDRRGSILFIEAQDLGRMETRVHRVLDPPARERIASACTAWRDPSGPAPDAPGFCRAATLDQVAAQDFVLTPGRYVGAAPRPEPLSPVAEVATLLAALETHRAEGRRLDAQITAALRGLDAN